MNFGLNGNEIRSILITDFDQEVDSRYDGADEHLSVDRLQIAIMVLRDRIEETIVANNKRMADQLRNAGIDLRM